MTQHELNTAALLLAEWERRLKAGGTLTESEKQAEQILLKLAATGLRMENVKHDDLAAAGRGLRITETLPDWMTQ